MINLKTRSKRWEKKKNWRLNESKSWLANGKRSCKDKNIKIKKEVQTKSEVGIRISTSTWIAIMKTSWWTTSINSRRRHPRLVAKITPQLPYPSKRLRQSESSTWHPRSISRHSSKWGREESPSAPHQRFYSKPTQIDRILVPRWLQIDHHDGREHHQIQEWDSQENQVS